MIASQLQSHFTDETKQTAKRNRYANLNTIFNFIASTFDSKIQNPFGTTVLKKLFNEAKPQPVPILV
jgi:hypothetical protein